MTGLRLRLLAEHHDGSARVCLMVKVASRISSLAPKESSKSAIQH